MTERPPRDFACLLVGLVVFAAAALAGFCAWALLGALTGVLGPCATAPGWWVLAYALLGLAVLLASASAARYVYERV